MHFWTKNILKNNHNDNDTTKQTKLDMCTYTYVIFILYSNSLCHILIFLEDPIDLTAITGDLLVVFASFGTARN